MNFSHWFEHRQSLNAEKKWKTREKTWIQKIFLGKKLVIICRGGGVGG